VTGVCHTPRITAKEDKFSASRFAIFPLILHQPGSERLLTATINSVSTSAPSMADESNPNQWGEAYSGGQHNGNGVNTADTAPAPEIESSSSFSSFIGPSTAVDPILDNPLYALAYSATNNQLPVAPPLLPSQFIHHDPSNAPSLPRLSSLTQPQNSREPCNNCLVHDWLCDGIYTCNTCLFLGRRGLDACSYDRTLLLHLSDDRNIPQHAALPESVVPAMPTTVSMSDYPENPIPLTPSPPSSNHRHHSEAGSSVPNMQDPLWSDPRHTSSPPRARGSSTTMQDLGERICEKCGKKTAGTMHRAKQGKRICGECFRSSRRGTHVPDTTNYRTGGPCALCEATVAPTWRRGPDGVKLCNACGLRKRSKQELAEKLAKAKQD